MTGLHAIAADLAGQPEPAFLRRLDGELLAGVETLLARHAAFLQWLVDHGRDA